MNGIYNALKTHCIVVFSFLNDIRMIIGDNDSKLYSNQLVELFESHGIEAYNGSGKTVGEHPNGYPPRSHDCIPAETHFANIFHQKRKKPILVEVHDDVEEFLGLLLG